jgi:hypothetical protein
VGGLDSNQYPLVAASVAYGPGGTGQVGRLAGGGQSLDFFCGARERGWAAHAENLLDLMFRRLGLDAPCDSLEITEATGDARVG